MAETKNVKLFAGERLLVGVAVLGFLLAGVCALYIGLYGKIVLPEGNVQHAFSFNAAIGMFILSVAAFMPLAGLMDRKRVQLRWGFIVITLIGYAIETIQHFRGINPRYSDAGSLIDVIVGGFFGLISLALIVVTVLFMAAFFRRNNRNDRPLINLGIRYAFVSTMLAYVSGMIMIVLQTRYTGAAGNFIVLHGLGFHALQALPFLGWVLERAQGEVKWHRMVIHVGSISWLAANVAIGLQTVLGRSAFEWTAFPLLAIVGLVIWLITAMGASWMFLQSRGEQQVIGSRGVVRSKQGKLL